MSFLRARTYEFKSNAAVAPGSRYTCLVVAQNIFRGQHLVFEQACREGFALLDLEICHMPQINNRNEAGDPLPIPGQVFADFPAANLKTDTCQKNGIMAMTVQNVGEVPREFAAKLSGDEMVPDLLVDMVYICDTTGFTDGRCWWWRPNAMGYTCDLKQAGLYPASYKKNIRPTDVFVPADKAWGMMELTVGYENFLSYMRYAKEEEGKTTP